jgi:hypothetical protein
MWFNKEPAVTLYFGIWGKPAAKIGNSIAFIPALYPSNDQDHMTESSPGGRRSSSLGDVDVSKLGAFAYRTESTKSLNQVTSLFLQQQVNFYDREEMGALLTGFKELEAYSLSAYRMERYFIFSSFQARAVRRLVN